MLNFRKLKHDFSPNILREGKTLFEKGMVISTKMTHLSDQVVKFHCRVMGSFENTYESELEVDRVESSLLDSDCDCPYNYDCQHLAAILFFLETHYEEILLDYSKETDLEQEEDPEETQEKKSIRVAVREAVQKQHVKLDKKFQKQMLEEYIFASSLLGQSSFFFSGEEPLTDKAELAIIFNLPAQKKADFIEFQLALRLPNRSKALNIPQLKPFLEAIRYKEPIYIAGKRYFFSLASFDSASSQLLKMVIDFARFLEPKNEKQQRHAHIDFDTFGSLLAESLSLAETRMNGISLPDYDADRNFMPCLYVGAIEEPLKYAQNPAEIRFELHYLEAPTPKILLQPGLILNQQNIIGCEEAFLFECAIPGMIFQNTYYHFKPSIRRKHLRNLPSIRDMTIPEPLFGTFIENALPELLRFAQVDNREILDRFVTLPFVKNVGAECDIHYLNGELEAVLHFVYGDMKVPAANSQLVIANILNFITPQGILARNLTEEQKIVDLLFQDFVYDHSQGTYSAKNEKKIVEFMTEVIPANQHLVKFNCPENLLDQFIYDDSIFHLSLKETNRIDMYEVEVQVQGHLSNANLDLLWDCLSSKRAFIELTNAKKAGKRKSKVDDPKTPHRILVLDLEKLGPVVQLLDEMGINQLHDHVEQKPLWSLASLDPDHFKDLPVRISISPKLKEIQKQMLGELPYEAREIPSVIQASLRKYQIDGIQWLDRLRSMHLNGILADDMGLGKTLQAIITLTQFHIDHPGQLSIVVCPTSLVYNWKEEFAKFNPQLKVLPVDGNPQQRKKLHNDIPHYNVIITSYTLLQKDVEFYKSIPFGYAILDEAQHIKNRGTRNAQSVKMIQTSHRLILTGTPIENSLDELWSLFDFLMPGLLSTYDRFVEKYIRSSSSVHPGKYIEHLRKKVSPFILRRMKQDVLDDLPPVSEIQYHCHLSEVQQELYRSYAASAREELSQLVKKEGFDRVQIHVLATLTRLKQICCHPAIFAKDKAESGDSAKYDMLMELLLTLIEGKHKTVIFSQYTRMLSIMREDLQKMGIRFEYLDGSSKNRLNIVKQFNEDPNVPIFLVSLKAGGSGLNLVGADTVIHYDMWWNPAVENQATDRVHRMGQKKSVSSYKLITLNTIEEKILDLHNRKKGLVKDIVSHDEEMIAKLTWEEVLELLQT